MLLPISYIIFWLGKLPSRASRSFAGLNGQRGAVEPIQFGAGELGEDRIEAHGE